MTTAPTPRDRALQWALVALALVSIVGSQIVTFFGLFGVEQTGEVSGAFFPIPIVPADYAFAIWGVIYPALLALAVAQALPWGRRRPGIRRARVPLAVNLVFNLAWIVTFGWQLFVLNSFILVGQFATGLWLYLALGREPDSDARFERALRAGASLYFGWLTVATVVGTSSTLSLSWDGGALSAAAWTAILLVVASAIGLAVRFLQRDPVYGGVFVWALVAIAVDRGQPVLVVGVAVALAAAFAATLIPPLARAARRRSAPST